MSDITAIKRITKKMMMLSIVLMAMTFSPVCCRKHSGHQGTRQAPTYEELSSAVASGLISLARTAHRPLSRLGVDVPLDPLSSNSELKYVHEGDLLRLKLLLDNVTLIGFKSLSVQEVTFKRPGENFYDDSWAPDIGLRHQYRGEEEDEGEDTEEEEEEEEGEGEEGQDFDYQDNWNHENLYSYEDWSRLNMQETSTTRDKRYQEGSGPLRHTHGSEGPLTSEAIVRVAFKQMSVKAKYQVRGSAGGFVTFRETGDLTLTSPTVFLTTKLNVTLPGFGNHPHQTPLPRHGRVKVLWARSNVSIGSTSLILQPGAYPPEWVRQQVQSKLEELSSDLSHGHGAVRLLLRRWGRLLKRLIHRTARSLVK